jgi:hypothetical protein
VWMAPALQAICGGLARWSGAVLCPACLRGHEQLALIGFRGRGPRPAAA